MNLYQHSGKVGFSPFLLLGAGIPLMIILSCIYAYITVYNPIAGYITFLILLGYVVANGFLIAFLGKAGKCRSRAFLLASGFVGGLFSLYFSWLFFIYALMKSAGYEDVGLLDIALNPSAMWSAISSLNETGWFSIKGATPSGIVLWIFWAIEAIAIVLGSLLIAGVSIEDEMFCEKCETWCDVSETKYLKIPQNLASSKASDINPLMLRNLENAEVVERPSIKGELLKCNSCVKYSGWRYKLISSEADKDGNEKDKSETIDGIVLA